MRNRLILKLYESQRGFPLEIHANVKDNNISNTVQEITEMQNSNQPNRGGQNPQRNRTAQTQAGKSQQPRSSNAPRRAAAYTDPMRPKRLLAHKVEIRKMQQQVMKQGLSLIPLQLYLKNGRVKMELGLCKGKKLYDKRDDMAKRDVKREIERSFAGRG